MIDRYLGRGTMYALIDGDTKTICVVTAEENRTLEIKNIATKAEYQRRGYGRKMVSFLEETYRGSYRFLKVGTGDSPYTVPFYEACGFHKSYVVKKFFTENYDHPIFEGGKQLIDMVYFEKNI